VVTKKSSRGWNVYEENGDVVAVLTGSRATWATHHLATLPDQPSDLCDNVVLPALQAIAEAANILADNPESVLYLHRAVANLIEAIGWNVGKETTDLGEVIAGRIDFTSERYHRQPDGSYLQILDGTRETELTPADLEAKFAEEPLPTDQDDEMLQAIQGLMDTPDDDDDQTLQPLQ